MVVIKENQMLTKADEGILEVKKVLDLKSKIREKRAKLNLHPQNMTAIEKLLIAVNLVIILLVIVWVKLFLAHMQINSIPANFESFSRFIGFFFSFFVLQALIMICLVLIRIREENLQR